MKFFLGIDGGGTKTAFLLADEDGRVSASWTAGHLDFSVIGAEGVGRVLADGAESVLAAAGAAAQDLAAVAAGIPKCGEFKSWSSHCLQIMAAVFPGIPTRCVNDAYVALFGAMALQPGINLVAGTGAIAAGRGETGDTARCGGWSEHYSDEGSCYWLGRMACSLFAKQSEGRLPKGPLYEIFMNEFEFSDDMDFIAYYQEHLHHSRVKIAALQLLLEKAALCGDRCATAAYQDAAAELAALVLAVRGKLFTPSCRPVRLSITGGLTKAGELIMKPLRDALALPDFQWMKPVLPPAGGAVLHAFEIAGYRPDQLAGIIHQMAKELSK